nr:hypothetical protein GCM10020185_41140 [Pseudomonas brassicacearum subsp. brassicacearum]
MNCFGAPFQAGEHEFFISASIGTSLYPQDGCDVATLVKNADAAMYRSKAKGRNRVESYTRDLTAQASERVALEHELRRAIERNELSLSFQPKNQPHRQPTGGCRSIDPLDAPHVRRRAAGTLHPSGGRKRHDPANRRLGVGARLPAVVRME